MIVYERFMPSTFDAVNESVGDIQEVLINKYPNIRRQDLFKIKFMLREILNNAAEHGNQFSVEKRIHCSVHFDFPIISFDISDEGEGIDLYKAIIPKEAEPLLRERHRGYQTIMDMGFNLQIYGSHIRITFILNKEEGQ